MIWLLFVTAIISQPDLPPGTALPDPNRIERITFANRDGVHFGSVEEQGNQLVIIYDTPWNPQAPQSMTSGSIATRTPEAPGNREKRLMEEARKAGFTVVDTAQGARWLPIEEVELARRAEELAKQLVAVAPAGPTQTAAPAVADASPAEAPAPYLRYGVQAAIALAGLIVAGLILRFWVFSS